MEVELIDLLPFLFSFAIKICDTQCFYCDIIW